MRRHELRPLAEADRPAVLSIINADRIPGQPVVTAGMLADAEAGRSPVDGGWWAELTNVQVDVLTDPKLGVLGVISYAPRPRDAAGIILWLHGLEDPGIVTELIGHALARLDGCPVIEAFGFATPLGLGLEALPVTHRPVTDHALRAAGFTGEDLWRYMHRDLPATGLPRAEGVETTAPDGHTRQFVVRDGGQLAAEATIGLPTAGIGTLWWISVEPRARGRGLGRALLRSALGLLAGLGAAEVICYVDDDDPDPGSDRSRAAANAFYGAAGFVEADRLCSYRLAR